MRISKLHIIVAFNIFLLMLSLWLKPRFQTNDDIGMIYAYSGSSIFTEPTAVTAFSTKIWGMLMVFFYHIAPKGAEVYTLVFFALIFVSSVKIQNKLLGDISQKSALFWLIFIPVLGFITLNFYLELQFTMVAGLLCFTGILITIYQPVKSESIQGIVLIILASLIRPSIIPVVLIFLFMLGMVLTFLSPGIIDARKLILKRFGIYTVILFTVYFTDNKIHTEAEKHFLEFNFYRGVIVDFNQTNANSIPASWGDEELNLFKNWFYNDTILYNSNKDYKVAGSGQNSGILKKIRLGDIGIQTILSQFRDPMFRCILMLAFIPLFFIKSWQRNLLYLCIVLLAYIGFYNLLLILFKSPPFRVYFMLFTVGMFMHLYYAIRMADFNSTGAMKLVPAGFIMLYGFWITKISLVYRYQDIKKTRCVEHYNPSIMYIRWAGYPFELTDPFSVSASDNAGKIVSMGAYSIHPAVKNEFGNFRYANLTDNILGKDSLVTFMMPKDTAEWKDFKSAYIAFIEKNYKRKVFFERVENSAHCYGYMDYKLMEEANAKLD